MLVSFLLGSVFIIVGLTLFLIGVDIGITSFGGLIGKSLLKANKLWIIINLRSNSWFSNIYCGAQSFGFSKPN
ncbi:DUF1538 family protein [Proteinivorax tanatarense]|uniref:DUF1538 family protein n=1 Tax=Proteinivorax tanatarense TaxID=1260629 RepID=UPI0033142BA4